MQVRKLKEWLPNDDNRRVVPVDQLQVVFGQLNSRETGIRGKTKLTIRFLLLWTVSHSLFYMTFNIVNIVLHQIFGNNAI